MEGIIIIHVGNKKLKPKLLHQMVGDHNKTSHIQSIAWMSTLVEPWERTPQNYNLLRIIHTHRTQNQTIMSSFYLSIYLSILNLTKQWHLEYSSELLNLYEIIIVRWFHSCMRLSNVFYLSTTTTTNFKAVKEKRREIADVITNSTPEKTKGNWWKSHH